MVRSASISDFLVETEVAATLTASRSPSRTRPVPRSVGIVDALIEKVSPKKTKKNVSRRKEISPWKTVSCFLRGSISRALEPRRKPFRIL